MTDGPRWPRHVMPPGHVVPSHPTTECRLLRCGQPSGPLVEGGPVQTIEQQSGPPVTMAQTTDAARPLPHWHPEQKLRQALGRPALAHKLFLELDQPTALELADAIDAAIDRRMSAWIERQHTEIDTAVTATLTRIAAAADEKRRELQHERFGTRSRLG